MGLKKIIRKPNCILQQIASRLSEQMSCGSHTVSKVTRTVIQLAVYDDWPCPRKRAVFRHIQYMMLILPYLMSSADWISWPCWGNKRQNSNNSHHKDGQKHGAGLRLQLLWSSRQARLYVTAAKRVCLR